MSDINLHCVSLSSGTLSPDLRVNYEFGLVLGVDEFRQEQLYLLEKAYLHDRSLHGYGTVYGLQVTTRPEGDDVVVTVEPGMGVDQWGRPVVVRSAQCARLGAWLAAEERRNPGAVDTHRGPSGELTLFVVASYAECLDALVPIPGQPCSSSEQSQAASRLRDAWNLELRWEPPAMPAWEAVRALATILTNIRVDASLGPTEGDEAAIVAMVRDLPGPPPGSPPHVGLWRLPAATALAALDRIFTVWVTEVRPRFAPDLTEPAPGDEAGILLAAVTFVADDPFSVDAPRVFSAGDPDDTGRPFLLHTQLVQELLLLGPGADTAPPPVVPTVAQPLVTLETVVEGGRPTAVSAWFHLDQPVRLPATVSVLRGALADREELAAKPVDDRDGFSVLWRLAPSSSQALRDDELLSFPFETTVINVGDAATTLQRFIEDGNLEIVGHDSEAHVVRAFHQVVQAPPVPGRAVEELPHLPFATITATRGQGENLIGEAEAVVEMWFHLDVDASVDHAWVDDFDLNLWAEVEPGRTPAPISIREHLNVVRHNVFEATVSLGEWPGHRYLRFVFPIDGMRLTVAGEQMPLDDYIRANRIHFDGFNGQESIVVYVRVEEGGRIE